MKISNSNKKRLQCRCFPENFAKFLRITFLQNTSRMVSGQLSPEENCPLVRVGVWVKVRVSFRVGGWSDNCPREKLPPPVMARVWVRVSFGVGRQFSSRAIVLEPLWMTASRLFHSLKNCFLPSSELIEPSFLYFWTCFIMAFERD